MKQKKKKDMQMSSLNMHDISLICIRDAVGQSAIAITTPTGVDSVNVIDESADAIPSNWIKPFHSLRCSFSGFPPDPFDEWNFYLQVEGEARTRVPEKVAPVSIVSLVDRVRLGQPVRPDEQRLVSGWKKEERENSIIKQIIQRESRTTSGRHLNTLTRDNCMYVRPFLVAANFLFFKKNQISLI